MTSSLARARFCTLKKARRVALVLDLAPGRARTCNPMIRSHTAGRRLGYVSLIEPFRFPFLNRALLGALRNITVQLLDNLLQAWQNALQPDRNVGLAMAIYACFRSAGRHDF